MDTTHFDCFIRSLTVAPSRRAVFGLSLTGGIASLLGLIDSQAKKRKRKKKKRKCKGRRKCGKRCIPKSSCCTDADCGPLKLCADGVCVVGQGSCPAGTDSCSLDVLRCGPLDPRCFCFQNTVGEVRCGEGDTLDPVNPCGECVNDGDCAALYPDDPGVFCTKGGDNCPCAGFTFCQRPCPN
jgi:hypothetical protein